MRRPERRLLLVGLVAAPVVFAAMIPRWYGPRGYTTIVDKMDVRPGGSWRFIAREPNGNESGFRGEYREVVAPDRLVQTFEWEPMAGHISVETATLTERDGRTLLTVRSLFSSKEDRDGMVQSGMEQGMRETHDRLAELLAEIGAEERSATR